MFPDGKGMLTGVLMRDLIAKANVDIRFHLMSRHRSAFHGEDDENEEDDEAFPDI